MDIELMGTKELAYHITMFDWDLFWAVHEYELLYHTFGRHHFGKVSFGFYLILFGVCVCRKIKTCCFLNLTNFSNKKKKKCLSCLS